MVLTVVTDKQVKFRAGSFPSRRSNSRSVGKGPGSFVHRWAVFCTPRKQEHFLKLRLSCCGVHIENRRCTGIYKHEFYLLVGTHLAFNAKRIEMSNSGIQGKMDHISCNYLKNA